MTTPTETQLARTVLAGPMDSILETWESANGCVAWVEKSDRRCGRDSPGYLCARHEAVGRRRWEKKAEKEWAAEMRRQGNRAMRFPGWQAELEKVEAEIRRLDPPPATTDRAAYGGQVHPSITRQRRAFLSDSRVQKLAALAQIVAEHNAFPAMAAALLAVLEKADATEDEVKGKSVEMFARAVADEFRTAIENHLPKGEA